MKTNTQQINDLCNLLIEDTKTNEDVHLGTNYYLSIADKIKRLTEENEDYDMLARENKCMAEALENLGYTQDQISDICSGAPIIK